MKKREIGSYFYLSAEEIITLEDLTVKNATTHNTLIGKSVVENAATDKRYLSSGRQAILLCLKDLQQDTEYNVKSKIALLPEYTCKSVIQPFLQQNYQLYFYPLDQNLNTSFSEINRLSGLFNASVVLFHPYFGFDTIQVDEALRGNVKYIYDATQSLFSNICYPQADYVIASIRKWGPFLDGAYCGKIKGKFSYQQIFPQDTEMLAVQKKAYQLKDKYIVTGEEGKEEFLNLFCEASLLLASRDEMHEMSEIALEYYSSIYIDALKKQRRANYQDLLHFTQWPQIGQIIFPTLSEQNVPLYFPFYVKGGKRDELQSFLNKANIYAPVIWPVPGFHVPEKLGDNSKWIYDNILVLPIDQRYSTEDMDRIKRTLKNCISKIK